MRKRDPVVREKILSYIKTECLREGGIIERSCKEIAEAVGVNPRNGERILNVVQSLQNSGNIIVYPGKGNRANKYEFIKEEMKFLEERAVYDIDLEKSINEMTERLMSITGFCKHLIDKNKELTIKMKQVEEIFRNIEHVGSSSQGYFFVTKNPDSVKMLNREAKDKKEKGESFFFGKEESVTIEEME